MLLKLFRSTLVRGHPKKSQKNGKLRVNTNQSIHRASQEVLVVRLKRYQTRDSKEGRSYIN
jgi:hypothetical protein